MYVSDTGHNRVRVIDFNANLIYTIAGACGFLLSSVAFVAFYWMPIPFLNFGGG